MRRCLRRAADLVDIAIMIDDLPAHCMHRPGVRRLGLAQPCLRTLKEVGGGLLARGVATKTVRLRGGESQRLRI